MQNKIKLYLENDLRPQFCFSVLLLNEIAKKSEFFHNESRIKVNSHVYCSMRFYTEYIHKDTFVAMMPQMWLSNTNIWNVSMIFYNLTMNCIV